MKRAKLELGLVGLNSGFINSYIDKPSLSLAGVEEEEELGGKKGKSEEENNEEEKDWA